MSRQLLAGEIYRCFFICVATADFVTDLLKPNSITLSGSNQLRTSSEPDSVMEFVGEPASSCYFAASKLGEVKFQFDPASNQLS